MVVSLTHDAAVAVKATAINWPNQSRLLSKHSDNTAGGTSTSRATQLPNSIECLCRCEWTLAIARLIASFVALAMCSSQDASETILTGAIGISSLCLFGGGAGVGSTVVSAACIAPTWRGINCTEWYIWCQRHTISQSPGPLISTTSPVRVLANHPVHSATLMRQHCLSSAQNTKNNNNSSLSRPRTR